MRRLTLDRNCDNNLVRHQLTFSILRKQLIYGRVQTGRQLMRGR